MQFTILAIAAAFASLVAADGFKHGQCGLHIKQKTRANNDDLVTFTVFDAAHSNIGSKSGGLSDAQPESIPSLLPHTIDCKQPRASHDIACTYAGYTFGTAKGCSVGKWSDGNQGTRQMDCGFAC